MFYTPVTLPVLPESNEVSPTEFGASKEAKRPSAAGIAKEEPEFKRKHVDSKQRKPSPQ